jgi:hypothetical protein
VLVRLGADLNRVRQQVTLLLHGYAPAAGAGRPDRGMLLSRADSRLGAMERRLAAIEQRVGIGPDTSDLDERIEMVRGERVSAADAQEYEQAASLRDNEKQLLASKTARQEEWAAKHPGLPSLAEQCQQLGEEIERLRDLLRQHGIESEGRPA